MVPYAVRSLVVVASASAVAAQCPLGGVSAHGRCWYLSQVGKSCVETCAANGIGYSFFVAPSEAPITPQLLQRSPATKQHPWARTECYVAQGDRYHTAKSSSDRNANDAGEPGDWRGENVCQLACPCEASAKASEASDAIASAPYPKCIQEGAVLRHAGAHAIFLDFSSYGSAGCWQNDCKNTDKFNADNKGICARACSAVEECTHWTFGEQDGATKCFFRKSDAGREAAEGWQAASKSCAPLALPSGYIAKVTADALKICDSGKSDLCPDMARAVTTWKFAIKHLKSAGEGKLDANTLQYIAQIAADTDSFASQMSEENFPVIIGNNRQVFNVLSSWLGSHTAPAADHNDDSLPNPVRGHLCGPTSCYEKVV
eukprot:TRINITY_DN360_c0_g3_i1.p1 TRINITY_DN360_c0_g3~~TRINITY_DN360_c0_g3_i1.p1  ORF type:complete len:404 (-),score=60.84 TRINITY_DN360_c0_g3_i1:287-1405(-)